MYIIFIEKEGQTVDRERNEPKPDIDEMIFKDAWKGPSER